MNTILSKMGLKQTKSRISVLNILKQADKPLTAEEIYLRMQKNDNSINLSTVYRTLETFLEKGIIEKPLIKDDVRHYTLNHNEHNHYLVCGECNKILKIAFCPFDDYERKIEAETNFTITCHKLELIGICPSCEDKAIKN